MNQLEFVQYQNEDIQGGILKPKIDGIFKTKLEEKMLVDSSKTSVDSIFSNSYRILPYLVDPNLKIKKTNKVLCLGKVQSGKTAFFICSIALAFDNGYNLAYVIGGTKIKLKNQNYSRIHSEFSNNDKVFVIDITDKNHPDPRNLINKGYKVILVALKNVGSSNANLGVVNEYSRILSDIPAIVIDDEGDECSPGAPKLKRCFSNVGKTHDVIVDIISNIEKCTFLSVTATPQANFLISTIDELSPDYALLVEPGDGYTGGNAFHDTFNNEHVVEIKDSDLFSTSIPESFMSALYFYIFSLLTHNYRGDKRPYSMLVHPSSLTKVQSMVVEKIVDFYLVVKKILKDNNSVAFDDCYNQIYNSSNEMITDFQDVQDFKLKTLPYLSFVLEQISIYEFNVSGSGKASIEAEQNEDFLYKIFVGGNMLGRGLTIRNLSVTYMYRDSKVSQIDTLYQRARWFGYKKSYFDLCRVYMTRDLKEKFIDIVENENDMWNALYSFLQTKTNIKQFPRMFTLNNDKLRLTRTTISRTVNVERVNPGYTYDKSIYLTEEEKQINRNLYNNFYSKYKSVGKDFQFGSSEIQHHLVIQLSFSLFYKEFLMNYCYPRGGKFGIKSFGKIYNQIRNGEYEDKISVVLMRYKTKEKRSAIANGLAIKELPQSYDNGTGYPGDKSLPGLEKILHIQLHPVYTDEQDKDSFIPMIALNNPITSFNVRYVTGDNYYG